MLLQTQGLLVEQTTEANSHMEANTQTHFRVFASLLEVGECFTNCLELPAVGKTGHNWINSFPSFQLPLLPHVQILVLLTFHMFVKIPRSCTIQKLDGVGPVDNRPSTDKLQHFYIYIFFYMSHVTRDTLGVVNIVSKSQLPSSNGLGFMKGWRSGGKGWLSHLINQSINEWQRCL